MKCKRADQMNQTTGVKAQLAWPYLYLQLSRKTQWLDMQTKKKKKKLHGIQILIYNVNINEL